MTIRIERIISHNLLVSNLYKIPHLLFFLFLNFNCSQQSTRTSVPTCRMTFYIIGFQTHTSIHSHRSQLTRLFFNRMCARDDIMLHSLSLTDTSRVDPRASGRLTSPRECDWENAPTLPPVPTGGGEGVRHVCIGC